MPVFFRALFFWLFMQLCASDAHAAARLLYVPLDDRPVCLEYTVNTLKAAGWDVVTPPPEFIASRYRTGEPDRLMDWLEEKAPAAAAAVVSSDAVIYGGLVASRTHGYGYETIARRAARLADLKARQLDLSLYIFSTIMRTPKASGGGVEPPYYEQWGPDIFRWSALTDKEELAGLRKKERAELAQLSAKLPDAVLADWLSRRLKNISINAYLIERLKTGSFDYLAMGKDDTAPYSQSHREARFLEEATGGGALYNYKMFTGADQIGLLLLTRAACEQNTLMPFVHTVYAPGAGKSTVPGYEDAPAEQTAESNISAAGGFATRFMEDADLALLLNTPPDGITKEAMFTRENALSDDDHTRAVLNLLAKICALKPVALADIRFANGASNALVNGLMKTGLAWRVAAYAGWNTAGNSIGYATGQGILAAQTPKTHKTKLLAVRYLDDWAYQANAREALYKELIWPRGLNGARLDSERAALEQTAMERIAKLTKNETGAGHFAGFTVSFPWNRLFEIRIILP